MRVGVLGWIGFAAVAGCRSDRAELPQGFRRVDIGGCRLNVLVVGLGKPTVVLEGGIFGTISGWEKVQPPVAEFARVIAYDRAGLGLSDPAPTEARTSAQIARELHRALRVAGVMPPYVLVGSSAGGFHIRLFAHQFPEKVVGLVLVDPAAEDWDDIERTQFPEEHKKSLAWRATPRAEGMMRQSAAWDASRQEARSAWPLPDVPAVLITGMKSNPDGSERKLYDAWLKLHEAWVERMPRGTHVITEKSGHFIQFTEPELVVGAISNIVVRVRSRTAK